VQTRTFLPFFSCHVLPEHGGWQEEQSREEIGGKPDSNHRKNQCYSQMVQAFHQLGCNLKKWQPILNIWQKDISDQQENFQLYSKVLTTMSLNKLTVWLIAINWLVAQVTLMVPKSTPSLIGSWDGIIACDNYCKQEVSPNQFLQ